MNDLLHRVLAQLPEAEGQKLVAIVMAPAQEPSEEEAEELLRGLKAKKVERVIAAGKELQADPMVGDTERLLLSGVLHDLELCRRELLGDTEGIEDELARAKRRYGA